MARPAASVDKRFMKIVSQVVVGWPHRITATRGVNPDFHAAVRCATFRSSHHACMRVACPAGTGPASIGNNRDGRISTRGTDKREQTMKATNRFWRTLVTLLAFASLLSVSSAAELNPAAVIYKLPD